MGAAVDVGGAGVVGAGVVGAGGAAVDVGRADVVVGAGVVGVGAGPVPFVTEISAQFLNSSKSHLPVCDSSPHVPQNWPLWHHLSTASQPSFRMFSK